MRIATAFAELPPDRSPVASVPSAWLALLQGRARLERCVHEYDSFVAHLAPARGKALSDVQCHILEAAALGEPHKAVGFTLDIAVSSVATLFRRALASTGLDRRHSAVWLRAALERTDGCSSNGFTHPVVVHVQARHALRDRLSTAEPDVVLRIASGDCTNVARARGTSHRTVANQLASVYRKLGISGRWELIRELVHDAETVCAQLGRAEVDALDRPVLGGARGQLYVIGGA